MLSKNITKILSAILSIIFVCSTMFAFSTTAFATSTSELNEKKNKIQSEIDSAQSKIDKLAKEKNKTQDYISALDEKIQLMQDKIDTLQSDSDALRDSIESVKVKIAKTEDEIEETQKEIDKKQKEFDKTFDEYCERLRAMYVSGSVTNLEVLLSSTDVSSVLTRSEMIKSVSRQDSQILDKLNKQMEQIEKDKVTLEKKRNELTQSKEKLVSDKKELDSNIADISKSKSQLDSEVDECNAMIKKLSSQTAQYQETISTNQDEIDAVENQIRQAILASQQQNNNNNNTGSSGGSTGGGVSNGRLGYPSDYTTISAGYPNYPSGRYHGGVDFPCPSGSSIRAAASGTVIVALNLNYSYGHYIVIDHGDGLSTLYAHNTSLLVGVGDHVSKGQTIALSGSTGNSTGPHCHFEVRVNGNRVNPMNYL